MRQLESCSLLPNRDFPSESHNIYYETRTKHYETAAENTILQNRVGNTDEKYYETWICKRYPGRKSRKVALYYETIMRRVVVLESLPFQEQAGLGLEEINVSYLEDKCVDGQRRTAAGTHRRGGTNSN